MGEAKRRAASDKYFGQIPKNGRGLVISSPIEVDSSGNLKGSTELDPLVLRRSLLFWDRLIWPLSNTLHFGDGPESEFLRQEGILTRPETTSSCGMVGTVFAREHLDAFMKADKAEPGAWALSEGEGSFIWRNKDFSEGRGTLIKLYRAIPIPAADVPLEDVLRFKQNRSDELTDLGITMDEFYSKVTNAQDSEFELLACLRNIEKQCGDVIKVAKEAKFRIRPSDLNFNLSANIGSIISAPKFAAMGKLVGEGFGLPMLGSLIGGALPFVGVSSGGAFLKSKTPQSAFRVVGNIHADMI